MVTRDLCTRLAQWRMIVYIVLNFIPTKDISLKPMAQCALLRRKGTRGRIQFSKSYPNPICAVQELCSTSVETGLLLASKWLWCEIRNAVVKTSLREISVHRHEFLHLLPFSKLLELLLFLRTESKVHVHGDWFWVLTMTSKMQGYCLNIESDDWGSAWGLSQV